MIREGKHVMSQFSNYNKDFRLPHEPNSRQTFLPKMSKNNSSNISGKHK
jgi:hypothetical protein